VRRERRGGSYRCLQPVFDSRTREDEIVATLRAKIGDAGLSRLADMVASRYWQVSIAAIQWPRPEAQQQHHAL
jgi:hypothetical protein